MGNCCQMLSNQIALLWHSLDRLRADQFDAPIARQLRSERIAALMNNLMPFTLFNASVAVFIGVWFYGRGVDLLISIWVAVLLTLSCLAIVVRIRRDPSRPYSGSEQTTRKIIYHAVITAACWAACFYFLIPVAGGTDELILNGLAVGGIILGPAVLHPVPRAALAWLATCAILNTISFLWLGDDAVHAAAFMNIAFTFVAGLNCLRQSDHMTRQFAVRQAHQEKQDMIALLLKEYEDGVRTWPWECDSHGYIDRMPDDVGRLRDRHCLKGTAHLLDLGRMTEAKNKVELTAALSALLDAPRRFHDLLILSEVPGEEKVWLSLSGKPKFDEDGFFIGYRGLISDVTETKLAEDRVHFLATHDTLTELPNRNVCMEAVNDWIDSGQRFVVLHIDLDRFKTVNDSMGHGAGDELLVGVAARLRHALATVTEDAICSRFGGDEFLAALPIDGDPGCFDVEKLCKEIIDALSKPFELNAGTTTVGTSIGYAFSPDDGTSFAELSNRADLALYRSKHEGRGRSSRYQEGMDRRAQDRKKLEVGLRQALAGNELYLHYQPFIDLEAGTVAGAEVLLRWHSEELGQVPPDVFIPIAEESGLIYKIGEWVLRRACHEMAMNEKPRRLAVNVSGKQLLQDDFVDMVLDTLGQSGLPPERLELELTESVLLSNAECALRAIDRLRSHGVGIVLDDFGTGYSSLNYLQSFAFDKIKIDRSFVANLRRQGTNGKPTADTLLRAIIGMGNMLEVAITAEGIEEEWQADELRNLGCQFGQGYLFSRPVPIDNLRSFVGDPANAGPRALALPERHRA